MSKVNSNRSPEDVYALLKPEVEELIQGPKPLLDDYNTNRDVHLLRYTTLISYRHPVNERTGPSTWTVRISSLVRHPEDKKVDGKEDGS